MTYTTMFIDQPRFECTEENRCGHTGQEPTEEENVEIGEMLQSESER